MNCVRIDIEGLEKPDTKEKVKAQLEGLIGVTQVKVSLNEPIVEVDFNNELTETEISSHLQNNGYRINDLR